MSEPVPRLAVADDGSFGDEPPARPPDHWVKAGAHWLNPAWPGWYCWRGGPGYYARLKLSTPPQVVGPVPVLSDLSLAIDARRRRAAR